MSEYVSKEGNALLLIISRTAPSLRRKGEQIGFVIGDRARWLRCAPSAQIRVGLRGLLPCGQSERLTAVPA